MSLTHKGHEFSAYAFRARICQPIMPPKKKLPPLQQNWTLSWLLYPRFRFHLRVTPKNCLIENGHFSRDTIINDVCDGQVFQSHPLFTAYPQALQIILYYDDLEICNPLGASVKKHKIGAFYFTLGNLKPRNRSLLHAIQLVALAKTSVIETYGINVILELFMASIRKLKKWVMTLW